jgi:hypothetical protein
MPVQKSKPDIPNQLLSFFASRLPDRSSEWATAMLAELEALPDSRQRMAWAISGSWALARIWARSSLRNIVFDPVKPWPVMLASAYHAIFCCALLYVIARQLPHITSPWTEAFFPTLFMFLVAIIPGGIALGLWVFDDSARYLAIVFSLIRGLGNYALLSNGRLPWSAWPVGRIGVDILIIGILVSPPIRRAFRPPPIHLALHN